MDRELQTTLCLATGALASRHEPTSDRSHPRLGGVHHLLGQQPIRQPYEIRRHSSPRTGEVKSGTPESNRRTRGPYKRPPEQSPRITPANPLAVAVLRFLALSGWREGEALSLRRDTLDARLQVARLENTKTGRSIRPLGKAALAVLQPLLTQPVRGNPYVFPGDRSGDHLKETKRLWIAAKHAAGLELRLHDLRHSFTTVGRELNYTDSIIAGLVGHVLEGMTSRYGDVPELTLRLAADNTSETIANRLAGERALSLARQQRA